MPTDAALLSQLQTLWQAAAPSAAPPTARQGEAADLDQEQVEPADDPEGDDPLAWLDDADREYLLGRHRYPERCGFCGGHYRHNPHCVALCDEWQILMPFGKHKGQPIRNVDTDYLLWLFKRNRTLTADVAQEIERVLTERRERAA